MQQEEAVTATASHPVNSESRNIPRGPCGLHVMSGRYAQLDRSVQYSVVQCDVLQHGSSAAQHSTVVHDIKHFMARAAFGERHRWMAIEL
jgi:hypothetical protein